ncbi:HAMP domain-containing histidine kinase [bacterium]|nr:HAMP domain-containing histidine kinase [bacterium]
MNYGLKPVSRLTIIFILAVLLSGSVLAYFSISNISNLKELTEKKVLEEQKIISERFSAAVTDKLDSMTGDLEEVAWITGNLRDILLKKAGEHDFIVHPFILNDQGRFLFPNFAGIEQDRNQTGFSGQFISCFREGEKAEFKMENLQKARENYLSSLGYATGSRDSVRALNALGRISVKMKEAHHGQDFYAGIVEKYYAETDVNGIPYLYYAIPQLLETNDKNNHQKVLSIIRFGLTKMEAGLVPLSYNTEDLLTLVTVRLTEIASDNPDDYDLIMTLITGIRKQYQFASTYGEELKELVAEADLDHIPAAGNGFTIAGPVSGTDKEYFLLNSDLVNNAGFLIDSKKLFDTVLATDMQYGLQFTYRIAFPRYRNAAIPDNDMVYVSTILPWFPDQQLEISLADEDLIQNIVNRRGWIYGLATVLLLVAMSLGVVLILRDIARERNLSRLRSDFISNVTHELKTPLTSIRMYAESLILERVKSAEEQKEYLSVVVNESDRLKRMINNILEFSKMEKGRPEYHFVRSDLAAVVREATDEMRHWFDQDGFVITSELEPGLYADIDTEKMRQALNNLFSNAIKYSPDSKMIFIRLFRNTDNACIEVEDRGIGIPGDKLSRIFEPFYRIGQEEGASGTGLGLTVVKEIIEAHKGTISVASEIGKGSKFKIQLPLGGKCSPQTPVSS